MRYPTIILLLLAAACGGTPAGSSDSAAPPATSTTSAAQPPPAAPAAACTPVANRLCPSDEASQDPSFAAFRKQLVETVEKRDTEALLRLVDPKIRTGFGPEGGIEDFRKQWKLDSGESPLWDELSKLLALGGTFGGEGESRSFWAPYVYSTWPEGKDSFTHAAALGPDTEIREKGDGTSPVIETVDWEILELVIREGWRPDDPWFQVRLADGKTGWVRAADVRSPIVWRAGFMKQNGAWRMNALVAGD